jgi:hypothetical protein
VLLRHDVRVLKQGALGLAAAVLAVAGLSACSDDDKGPSLADSATKGAAAASASPTGLHVPDGVTLTAEGSQLTVGDTATVAYEPSAGQVGVLDVAVTRLEKTTFRKSFQGWNLDDAQRKAQPYFVRATVTNRGETDLAGLPVPLYIVDSTNALVEQTTFASSFTPCQPGTFPAPFAAGTSTDVCLVYLAPDKGQLTSVSFRPSQEVDPITWTGPLEAPQPAAPAKKGKKKRAS